MKKKYLTPSLDLATIFNEEVLSISNQIVDIIGDDKDHLQGWDF